MNIVTHNTLLQCKGVLNDKVAIIEQMDACKSICKFEFEGEYIYLRHRNSVQENVKKFINSLNITNIESDFVVFGLGSGEHILELTKIISPLSRILIVEPSVSVVKKFLSASYSEDILNNDNIILFLYDKSKMTEVMGEFLKAYNVANTKCGVFANYGEVYPEIFADVYGNFINIEKSMIIDLNTHIVHSQHFFKSFINNLKFIIESPRVNCIKGAYKNMPAVVVSAGPSLARNIHILKDFQEKFIIIAGGRTLKVLMDMGITPDFVCVIDPDTPALDVMKDSLECDIPLVYSEFTSYEVVEKYSGKKIFFTDTGAGNSIRNLFDEPIDNIYEAGSVAHVCTGLAQYLGCNAIIFVGQDFAYTNNKEHFDTENTNCELDKNVIYVEGIDREKVKSSKILTFYKFGIENFIEMNKEITFVNSTEGGANIKGTKIMKLQEALRIFGAKVKDRSIIEKRLENNISKSDKGNVENKIELAIRNIKIIREMCISALNSYKVYVEFKKNGYDNIESLAANFNSTNDMIFNSINELELINILLSPAFINIKGNPEFKEKNSMDIQEKNTIAIKRNTILYNNIVKASNELLNYIKNLEI